MPKSRKGRESLGKETRPMAKKKSGLKGIWGELKKNPAILIVTILAIAAVIYIIAKNGSNNLGGNPSTNAAGDTSGAGGYYLLTDGGSSIVNNYPQTLHTKKDHVTVHHPSHSTSHGGGKHPSPSTPHGGGKHPSPSSHGTKPTKISHHSGNKVTNPNVHSTKSVTSTSTHKVSYIHHQTGKGSTHAEKKVNPNSLPKAKVHSVSGKSVTKHAVTPNPHAGGAHGWVYTTKPGDTLQSLQNKSWPGSKYSNGTGQVGRSNASIDSYANNAKLLKAQHVAQVKYTSGAKGAKVHKIFNPSAQLKPGTKIVL